MITGNLLRCEPCLARSRTQVRSLAIRGSTPRILPVLTRQRRRAGRLRLVLNKVRVGSIGFCVLRVGTACEQGQDARHARVRKAERTLVREHFRIPRVTPQIAPVHTPSRKQERLLGNEETQPCRSKKARLLKTQRILVRMFFLSRGRAAKPSVQMISPS